MLAVNILFIKLRNYLAITRSDLATNKIVIASFLLRLSSDFFPSVFGVYYLLILSYDSCILENHVTTGDFLHF